MDKAYEAVNMLRDLDLPISIDQLEDIERLERENGTDPQKDLRNYFYKKTFANYTKRIMNIRQAIIRGEVIVAKPVLLLAIIDGIDLNLFINNRIPLTNWLENRYVALMHRFMRSSQFNKPTDISNPFWHLQGDGFWHLVGTECVKSQKNTPSKAWLKEHVEYASFDESLWILLQNKEWRMKLREYIIEHKLTDNRTFGKMAAEGLGALAALLFVA